MRVVPDELPPEPARLKDALKFLVLLIAVVAAAAAGSTWRRNYSPTVTIEDAFRIFASPQDSVEKEQALGMLSRHQRNITALQIACEFDDADAKTANDARLYLDQIEAMLRTRRKR